jgi:hypothetical protein
MPTIDYQNLGLADVQTDSFTQTELFFGDTPAVVTEDAIVPSAIATAGLAAWTPVFVDPATRVISLADNDAGGTGVNANAVTVVGVDAGSPADIGLSVYTAGHFNMNALNWPAEYTTDAHKRGAFAVATANQIRVSVPYYS